MKLIFFLIVLFPHLGKSQGVSWTDSKNWEQVLNKAKTENKFIFVDCYATWCGPCKKMDKYVYQNDTVGKLINNSFVSVRLQLDTGKNDNEKVKEWYADAHKIAGLLNVKSYPTFLFFSPSGDLVHEDIGFMDVKSFTALAENAMNPKTQFFTQIKDYEQGIKDYTLMPDLVLKALKFNNNELAERMAKDFIHTAFEKDKQTLLNKKNIQLLTTFTNTSKDPGFWLLIDSSYTIDKTMSTPGYSKKYTIYIISKEEIDPVITDCLRMNSIPDWQQLINKIEKKYNDYYSERCVLEAKIRWYGYKENWNECTKNIMVLMKNFGHDFSNWDINGFSMQVLEHSANPNELKAACGWMKNVLSTESDSTNLLPASLDTYANLLYKSGNIKDAIATEERALNLSTIHNIANFKHDFQITLDKMRHGETLF